LTGVSLRDASQKAAKVLGCEDLAVLDTLRLAPRNELTTKQVFELSWWLAGNVSALRAGRSLRPFLPPEKPYLVPIEILSARKIVTPRGKAGVLFKTRFMAGPPCPQVVEKYWPLSFLPLLAKTLGFPRHGQSGAFRNYVELVRMRCHVRIEKDRCLEGQPGFDHVKATDSDKTHNKLIVQYRQRVDPPCPRKFNHECWQCPIGYAECPAGTHRLTYLKKFCHSCGEENRFHDPDAPSGYCVSCDDRIAQRLSHA
jgi:hypothetical protein